jgi:hypothetical protein
MRQPSHARAKKPPAELVILDKSFLPAIGRAKEKGRGMSKPCQPQSRFEQSKEDDWSADEQPEPQAPEFPADWLGSRLPANFRF